VTGSPVLDAAGRRRSPATIPGFHAGRSPRNKGLRYPVDPPTVTEIVAVMQIVGDRLHGRRLRGLVAVLWRAGLRIDEALVLWRFAPHQLRHAHAVEIARGGVPLIVIQRQLGYSHLGITSVYLQGIDDNAEIIETVHARRAPMIPVSAWPRS
jgi:integrase